MNMEIIVNNKTLENNINVIQLETAVGAAMKCFEGGLGKSLFVVYTGVANYCIHWLIRSATEWLFTWTIVWLVQWIP